MAKTYPKECCFRCRFRTVLWDYENYPFGRYERDCCTVLMQENKPQVVMMIYKLAGRCKYFEKAAVQKVHKFDRIGKE